MPLRTGRDQHGAGRVERQGTVHLGLGLGDGLRLDRLTLAIEAIEVGGDPGRFVRVRRRQKPGTEGRIADAATGIDARPEDEAEMPRFRRFAQRGRVQQGRQADAAAMAHHRQALRHEGPVETGEGHDVGHGRQRYEVEGVGELRFGAVRPEEALQPQGTVQCHQGEEHDPGGTEMAEARQVVEAVGIDHGAGRRQHLGGRMMVEDDHVEARFLGFFQRRVAARAAIDADQKRRAVRRQCGDRSDVGAVALGDPIGDVDRSPQAHTAQVAGEQGRARSAVHVVVAEDRHGLAAAHGPDQAADGGVHIEQRIRVRHQVAQTRRKVARRGLRTDPAPCQHTGEQFRQAVGLNHLGDVILDRRAATALLPAPAGDGGGDPQEGRRIDGERGG